MGLLHVMVILGPSLTAAPVWDLAGLLAEGREKYRASFQKRLLTFHWLEQVIWPSVMSAREE